MEQLTAGLCVWRAATVQSSNNISHDKKNDMQHKYLNTFLVIFLFYTITTSLHFTERSQNVPECPQYSHHEGVVSFRDTVGADHVAE